MSSTTALGRTLSRHLASNGVSHRAAADRIGVAPSTLSKALRGQRPLLMTYLGEISTLVEVSPSMLVEEAELERDWPSA